MTNFPEVEAVPFVDNSKYPHSEAWFPFESAFLLKGKIEPCPMTYTTCEFEAVFSRFCEENEIKPENERKFLERMQRQNNIHRISSYPHFTQFDPRGDNDDAQKYDTLLLQINTQYSHEKGWEICWGDNGIANFFINLEYLKNLNFQDVMYTWDCC